MDWIITLEPPSCRAVRPIDIDEEISISYTDLKVTRPQRRAFLQQHYHFDIDAGAAAEGAQESAPMVEVRTSGTEQRWGGV